MPSGREQHDCWGLFDAGLDSLSIGPQELAFSTRANSETDTRTRGIAELAAGGVRHGREGGPPSWAATHGPARCVFMFSYHLGM